MPLEKDNPKYEQTFHANGDCELIIYLPEPNDSGNYVCKAMNCVGESMVEHPVLFEGIAQHVVSNRHRVFHSDQERVERAKVSGRGGIPLPEPEPELEPEPVPERRSNRPGMPPTGKK